MTRGTEDTDEIEEDGIPDWMLGLPIPRTLEDWRCLAVALFITLVFILISVH